MGRIFRARCATCGTALPQQSRFCPLCGQPTADGDAEHPSYTLEHAERRLFGVAPFPALAGAAVALPAATVVLFAVGRWPIAIPVAALASIAAVLAAGGARRHPESRIVLVVSALGRALRARIHFALEAVGAWSEANRTLFRLRREVRALVRQREAALRALGAATYAGDEAAAAAARETVAACDEAVAERERAAERVVAAARRRVTAERALMTPTESLPPRAAERLASH